MGKEIAKMFLQAVIFGIGVEVGKDIYVWVKGGGRARAEALPDNDEGPPEMGVAPTD